MCPYHSMQTRVPSMSRSFQAREYWNPLHLFSRDVNFAANEKQGVSERAEKLRRLARCNIASRIGGERKHGQVREEIASVHTDISCDRELAGDCAGRSRYGGAARTGRPLWTEDSDGGYRDSELERS